MPLLTPKRVVVSGRDGIASTLTARLLAAGRPVVHVDDPLRSGRMLRSAHTLILTDPAQAPEALAEGLAALGGKRPRRRQRLRVILLHTEAPPPPLPQLPPDAPLTMETFDLLKHAARACLTRWPLHAGMDAPLGQAVHLLIAGTTPPARALALHALRLMHYGERRPLLSFVCDDPDALREEWHAAFPQSSRFCRLRFTGLEVLDLGDQPPVTSAFVCVDPPEQGLEIADRLARSIAKQRGASPLICLEIGAVEPAGGIGDWGGQIVPFSWLREASRPDVLLDGESDDMARIIHDHYRDSIAAQGRDPAAEPAGRPWEALAASYRDANRHQADHLWAKLAVTDCRAVPEDLVESFAFAPLEVERMAIIEHARWAADRYLDGWTHAPVRDNARKHHPQLIPFGQLSAPMKDLDRFAVRLAPTLLARSGRGVVRMLLVGIPDALPECPADPRLEGLADQALDRLRQRYPDRSLVLASTLRSAATRLLVRLGVEHYAAGLFLLCPEPFSDLLANQPDDRARRDLLELVAWAERRIPLPGGDALAQWFATRAEISLLLGDVQAVDETGKRVRIDPGADRLDWGFEY